MKCNEFLVIVITIIGYFCGHIPLSTMFLEEMDAVLFGHFLLSMQFAQFLFHVYGWMS